MSSKLSVNIHKVMDIVEINFGLNDFRVKHFTYKNLSFSMRFMYSTLYSVVNGGQHGHKGP